MRIISKILMLSILGTVVVACDKKKDDTVNRITESLKKDLNLNGINITNAVELISNVNLPEEFANDMTLGEDFTMNEIENIQETPVLVTKVVDNVARQDSQSHLYNSASIKNREQLNIVQQESYIKLGIDKPGIRVNRNKSQKITVVIFPEQYAEMVDVYIFAVPTSSYLIRNNNTLIGYARGLEFVNGQAQFTRYWSARLVNGKFMKSRRYNIYVEYHYKNSKGKVMLTKGRYWGGNHRKWNVIL